MVELPKQGTFYRVLAGPIANQARATDLCEELKKEGQDCLTLETEVTKEPIF
jgi:cell division septation protein DedD